LALAGCAENILYQNIDNQQLKVMLENGVPVFDVRRPEEWRQTGVIEGSNRLTFVDKNGRLSPDFFQVFSKSIHKDQPVILICLTGGRTRSLAAHLSKELGYTGIYNVKNGIASWIRAGGAVKKSRAYR